MLFVDRSTLTFSRFNVVWICILIKISCCNAHMYYYTWLLVCT